MESQSPLSPQSRTSGPRDAIAKGCTVCCQRFWYVQQRSVSRRSVVNNIRLLCFVCLLYRARGLCYRRKALFIGLAMSVIVIVVRVAARVKQDTHPKTRPKVEYIRPAVLDVQRSSFLPPFTGPKQHQAAVSEFMQNLRRYTRPADCCRREGDMSGSTAENCRYCDATRMAIPSKKELARILARMRADKTSTTPRDPPNHETASW